VGKPVYILMNTRTRNAVRIYCHYWATFDQNGDFSKRRRHATSSLATKEEHDAFQQELKNKINEILNAPEESLFSFKKITMEPPPKSGKYQAEACTGCGEHTHSGRLRLVDGKKFCQTCAEAMSTRQS
jgi:formylmethanofuran dehydrogenase subunit E